MTVGRFRKLRTPAGCTGYGWLIKACLVDRRREWRAGHRCGAEFDRREFVVSFRVHGLTVGVVGATSPSPSPKTVDLEFAA